MIGKLAKYQLTWWITGIALLAAIYFFIQMDRQNAVNQMNVETKSNIENKAKDATE